MKILVTGASGFIGRHVCRAFTERGDHVVALVRKHDQALKASEQVPIADIEDVISHVFVDVEVVIHLAGLAEGRGNSETELYRVNVDGTRKVLEAARAAAVSRFVFISSIKAVAETSETPIRVDGDPRPQTAYGRSKLEAEKLVDSVASSELKAQIVRVPLVYGEGVSGNFRSLMKLAESGIPLPIGGIQNRRDFLSIENLQDFLIYSINNDLSTDTYQLTDGAALSLPDLIRAIRKSRNMRSGIFWMPVTLVKLVSWLVMGRAAQKLLGNLEIEDARGGWCSRFDTEKAIARWLVSN